VRIHDLRHSFASVGASAGLGLPVLGAILGHRNQATTARYAHLHDDPRRAAAAQISVVQATRRHSPQSQSGPRIQIPDRRRMRILPLPTVATPPGTARRSATHPQWHPWLPAIWSTAPKVKKKQSSADADARLLRLYIQTILRRCSTDASQVQEILRLTTERIGGTSGPAPCRDRPLDEAGETTASDAADANATQTLVMLSSII
jgi:hypothetical protein